MPPAKFSGAEIEAAVVGALYRAYAAKAKLTTEAILEERAATVPLSQARPEDMGPLHHWRPTPSLPEAAPARRGGAGLKRTAVYTPAVTRATPWTSAS
jgi:hypothetical protein